MGPLFLVVLLSLFLEGLISQYVHIYLPDSMYTYHFNGTVYLLFQWLVQKV